MVGGSACFQQVSLHGVQVPSKSGPTCKTRVCEAEQKLSQDKGR